MKMPVVASICTGSRAIMFAEHVAVLTLSLPVKNKVWFCFLVKLRKTSYFSAQSQEERWRSLVNWDDLFKEFRRFHKHSKMMEEENCTSFLLAQCFFLSRLKNFTEEWRCFSLSYRLPGINLCHATKCHLQRDYTISYLSLFHNLSVCREVPTGNWLFFSVKLLFWKWVTIPRQQIRVKEM